MNRAVSFEYMNRQLVWNEFSVLLPLFLNSFVLNLWNLVGYMGSFIYLLVETNDYVCLDFS